MRRGSAEICEEPDKVRRGRPTLVPVTGRDRRRRNSVNLARRRDARSMGLTAVEEFQQAYVSAVEKAAASVVNIGSHPLWDESRFRGFPRRGVGSGVVLDGQGHILTNHHVVDGTEQGLATLPDGRMLKRSEERRVGKEGR